MTGSPRIMRREVMTVQPQHQILLFGIEKTESTCESHMNSKKRTWKMEESKHRERKRKRVLERKISAAHTRNHGGRRNVHW